MNKADNILSLLLNPNSRLAVNELVELCYKVALSYICFNYRKVQNVISREDISTEDLAIDSIASLFEKDSASGEYNLINSFKFWKPSIETEEEAIFFLNKIVARRVEQHISMLLRESDPVFSKILDSINYLIKKHSFAKRHYLGRTYILPDIQTEIFNKVIPVEEFESISSKVFLDNKNVLKKVFTYLSSSTDFAPAIPLNALILKLKQLNISLYNLNESSTQSDKLIEANSIVERALNETFQKLHHSYIDNGKLSEEEAENFRNTLKDMANDLQDGGLNPGLYKYLSIYQPELTEEVYKIKYHNILEYLLKILKQNIAKELEH